MNVEVCLFSGIVLILNNFLLLSVPELEKKLALAQTESESTFLKDAWFQGNVISASIKPLTDQGWQTFPYSSTQTLLKNFVCKEY